MGQFKTQSTSFRLFELLSAECLNIVNGTVRFNPSLTTKIFPLLKLSQFAPTNQPGKLGDVFNPQPWLEAYAAGVGSPLELKFLRLFEQKGFHPQKQFPLSLSPGESPTSIPDFAIPEKRVAIYIDGAAFHRGANLRRDRFIRNKLRDAGWQVVELQASDLDEGAALVARLQK